MSLIPNIYTVESVTSGHPDKVCDQVSDAILDACLSQDPMSRVAVETFGSHGLLVVGGEVTTKARVDYEAVARSVYRDIGYKDELEVIVNISEQSPDIAAGVDPGGAGDQGIMYGFATNETPELLPKGVVLAHALTRGLELLRSRGLVSWLKPDGKAQVTMQDGRVRSVLVSCQHEESVGYSTITETITHELIRPVLNGAARTWNEPTSNGIEILVNPTGSFVRGGFEADTGLTGRKIMVDTYGGLIPHGGGAFSGKDATKVDRSGAYMARFAAADLVRRGLASSCLVSVAYAIGRAEPLMVEASDQDGKPVGAVAEFDFRPASMIATLGLRRPLFRSTAAYGHFGKNLPWG